MSTVETSARAGADSRTDRLRASPRMFDSPLLDALSRVHPAVPVVLYVPVIVALLVLGFERASALPAVGAIVGGYAIWTLTEYWLHRVVFHFEPEARWGARLHWIIHGVHHDHPNDPKRLVMPPSVSAPLASLFGFVFWLILGAPLWLPFTGGFLAGYLAYDMTHYYVHHHRPRSWVGRKLRELHMRHHFQDDTAGYGVSAPWWDFVFRTAPKAARRQRPAEIP